jgi:hypothetical protein
MQPLRALLVYVVGVFVVSALVAPWFFGLAQWLVRTVPACAALAEHPFHRYVHRALLVTAVAGLVPFLRSVGVNSWRDVGIVKPAGQWDRLGAGLALGFGSLACVALAALAAGARTLAGNVGGLALLEGLGGAAVTALVVSMLEELMFRGALFGALRKAFRWTTALLVSSLVYALVHFFQRPPSPEPVTWASGFVVLAAMLRGLGEVATLVPGFFSLTLAGAILAYAYQRTGNLYFPIGLHAGWIFWLKCYGFLTVEVPGASPALWGTGRLLDGWLALALLALAFAVVWFAFRRRSAVADAP